MRSSANSGLVLKTTSPGMRASRRRFRSWVQLLGRYSAKSTGTCSVGVASVRHADLTVRDLARRARVLALDPDGVGSLLEPPRVVDDPIGDRLARGQGGDGVLRSLTTDGVIVPRGVDQEVTEPLLQGIGRLRIGTDTGSDGLDTLALSVGEKAKSEGGERGPPLLVAEGVSDQVEVVDEPLLCVAVHGELEVHGEQKIMGERRVPIFRRRNSQGIGMIQLSPTVFSTSLGPPRRTRRSDAVVLGSSGVRLEPVK